MGKKNWPQIQHTMIKFPSTTLEKHFLKFAQKKHDRFTIVRGAGLYFGTFHFSELPYSMQSGIVLEWLEQMGIKIYKEQKGHFVVISDESYADEINNYQYKTCSTLKEAIELAFLWYDTKYNNELNKLPKRVIEVYLTAESETHYGCLTKKFLPPRDGLWLNSSLVWFPKKFCTLMVQETENGRKYKIKAPDWFLKKNNL